MAEEDAIRRVMPHSIEAEQSVIGAMLMDAEAIEAASEMLKEEDFYARQYGVLFTAILEMHRNGIAVDPVTLQSRLREKNLPPEVYGTGVILELIEQVPTSANIRSYAKIVSEKSLLRRMIRANEEIAGACYTQKDDLEVIMNDAEKRIFEISQRRDSNGFVPIRQIVINAIEKIEYASHIKGNVTGLSTGFTDLDNRTAGFQNSDLILIAARPSMGKTALVLNIAQHLALKENRCVAIFSLEMSKEQLVTRVLSNEALVENGRLISGNLRESDWVKIAEAASTLSRTDIKIDDNPLLTVADMNAKCRRIENLGLVVIDYLQLMTSAGGKGYSGENRQQAVSDISRMLKIMAKELQVPVLCLSQLSRANEKRDDKRPMLSDLRESGAIEQDADIVLFLYRDDYYNEDSEKHNIAECIVAKNRHGETGKVELRWMPEYTTFGTLERRYEDE